MNNFIFSWCKFNIIFKKMEKIIIGTLFLNLQEYVEKFLSQKLHL